MSEEKKKAMADEEDERELEREAEKERAEEKAAPRPSGPVGPFVPFNRGVRVWLTLTAFMFAGAVYFLPLGDFFLTRTLFQIGQTPVRAMIFVAAAVFGGLMWAAFRYFGGLLDYAKPGQGRWARLVGYLGFAFFCVFGGISLHRALYAGFSSNSPLLFDLWSTTLIGIEITLRPIFFPSAAVGMGILLAYHFFMNRGKWVEFMIETQSEVRRVSWPPNREWIGSSIVVVVVLVFISVFLYVVDAGLSYALQKLRIGF